MDAIQRAVSDGAGVRGEKAKNFEFPKVRFIESEHLQLSEAPWDHEPTNLT